MRPTLTHIAFHCRNIEASTQFYKEMCGLDLVHTRCEHGVRVSWLAEPGKEQDFVIVLIDGGKRPHQQEGDFSHVGFAVSEKADVDAACARAREKNWNVAWEPAQAPFPVGYFCGIEDPDGHVVEFSFGQPLGPGAPKNPFH